ncbi:MAG: hypothetical protein RLZZ444_4709, partial [Pseudomonadota bacterium]
MGIAATGIITLKDRIRPESSGFPLFSYGGDLGWIAGWFVDRDTIRIGHIGEDGTAIGKPVTIQSTFEQAILSDVSWLSDGGYVVSYYSATQQGGYDSIQTVLQYDSDNKLVAKNTLEAEHPDLLTLESGGYLLMYRSNFNGSNGAYDLTARIYDPLGSMIKDIELGHIDFSKRYYTERLADGFWSATITDTHSASTNTLYDSHGNKITSVHAARNSTVSFNVDGSYEVETFQTENEHGSIRLRTYDASKQLISSKIVGEFDYQNTLYEHSTYLLETGIRLLFWRDEGVDRTHPVHMTIYNSDGSVLKENVILSKSAASIPEIFELSDGGWLARIDSFIYAYSPEGKPYGPAIRSDSWNRIEVTDDGGWIINHREYDIKSGTDSYYSQVFHPNFGKNNAPVTYDFTFTGKEDRAYNFSGRHGILSDDFDGDRIKSLVVDSTPTFGRLMFDGKLVRSGDVIPVNQLASMNWIPEKDAFGDNLASFRFHVIDEHGLASEQTSTITLGLENVSDAPTTRSRSITILEDQTY